MSYVKSIEGIGNLPVDNVTDMTSMFNGTSSAVRWANVRLDTFDRNTLLSEWSADNVIWAKNMFKKSGFSSVVLHPRFFKYARDISCLFQGSCIKEFWYNDQMGNGTTYDYMFKDCKYLEYVSLTGHLINPSTVTSQYEMFKGCDSLKMIENTSQADDHC